jgi:thiamine-monophosphate kinase
MKALQRIGEFGLIKRLTKRIINDKSVIRGVGDDAAVISYRRGKYLLFATDMLVEGVHFRQKEASFLQIGRKALAVNISDIAAMGGIPKYAVVSLGFPKSLCVRALDDMMRGITTLAKEYGINVVGGDTVRSGKIVLNVSLIGEVKKRNLVLRSGAKVGDLIFVTGSLGGSGKLKQFNFIPRVKEAQELIKIFNPTAMIDISDGLASDLRRIAEQSEVGAVIFKQLIPVAPRASLQSALYTGEDFELLFTVSLDSARRFQEKGKVPVTCIGKIVEKKRGLTIIASRAKVTTLKEEGFRHF